MNGEKEILKELSDIKVELVRMSGTLERNTDDVAEHIKRTNALEKKIRKMEILIWCGAGAGIAEYGGSILKLIGILS